MQKKLKVCLQEAIGSSERANVPQDIVAQFETIQEQKSQLVQNSFSESATAKHQRLAEEFDIICDVQNSEREYVNMLIDEPNSADKWYEFSLFSLKFNMQAKAEQYLEKVIKLQGMSKDMHLMLASMML